MDYLYRTILKGNYHGRWPIWALLFVAAVYGTTILLLPQDGFWVIDNSLKYLQVRSLLTSGFRSTAIPWPGAAVDPLFRFNPLPGLFSIVEGGQLHSHFTPFFALASAIFYRLLGASGLLVLPLAGGLLSLVGLIRLSRRLGLSPAGQALAVLVTGLATPFWFYSVTFWEHVPAVCLVIWSLEALFDYAGSGSQKALARCAFMAGMAVWFRDELYLFLPVLLTGALLLGRSGRWRTTSLFGAMVIFAVMPLWLLNWWYTGHPFGFHATVNLATSSSLNQHFCERGMAFWRLFVSFGLPWWLSLLLAVPYLSSFLLYPAVSRKNFPPVLHALAWMGTFSFCFYFPGFFKKEGPILHLLSTNNLFAASPILLLAFVREKENLSTRPGEGEEWRYRRLLWLILLAYCILYWLAAPAYSTFGIHWGNRFLLLFYPLAAVLFAGNLNRRPWMKWKSSRFLILSMALTLFVSICAQGYSIALLRKAKEFSIRLNKTVASAPEEAVVTRTWFLPGMLYGSFLEKKIFYLRNKSELGIIAPRLVAMGTRKILAVDAVIQQADEWPWSRSPATIIDDGGLGYYTSLLNHLDLP